MSFVKIWVHLVFATKNRQPLLESKFRSELYNHIRENCKEKGIFLKAINGYSDHIHCLISLGKDQSMVSVHLGNDITMSWHSSRILLYH